MSTRCSSTRAGSWPEPDSRARRSPGSIVETATVAPTRWAPRPSLGSARGRIAEAYDASVGRLAGTALLVAVAYYAGANLGFVLRVPPATPSVLWPPNTILTAALLMSPPRRWGIYLLAALPAHLAAELNVGWP